MNRRNWNAYCCDDLVSQRCTGGTNNEEIERKKEMVMGGFQYVCVLLVDFPVGGNFEWKFIHRKRTVWRTQGGVPWLYVDRQLEDECH